MPESVDMPAPVSTAMRRPPSTAISSGDSTTSRIRVGRISPAHSVSAQTLRDAIEDLGVHVLFHHLQRCLAEVVVDVRDGVARDDDREMANVRVERGVEDALLGDLTGQHEALGFQHMAARIPSE